MLFVIRTRDRPRQSKPSAALACTTLGGAAFGVMLPYLPIAHVFGFEPLPGKLLVPLLAVVVTYLVLVELVKRRVLGRAASTPAGARTTG